MKSAGKSVEEEMNWQEEQLPSDIKELVLTARESRIGNELKKVKEGKGGGK